MKEPKIQMQISQSGNSVWLVLIREDREGNIVRTRFGQSAGLVRAYINRTIGSPYLTFDLTKFDKKGKGKGV